MSFPDVKVRLLPQQVEFCTGVATSPLLLLIMLKQFHLLDGTSLGKHLTHSLTLPFAQLLCEMLCYILLQ